MYKLRSRKYWLRRLENYGRKERVSVDEHSIEHILPQNTNLSSAWKRELGANWRRVQEQWLHTLGNLTLTAYNNKYRDFSFAEKRDMKCGFRESPLKLNSGLGRVARWDEAAIRKRAAQLADYALSVWAAPQLDAAVLATYRHERSHCSAYTIEDHPNLLNPTVRPLFEAFRKEVLALSPCVNEEFLKHYVAYKAETNFVDVVPQTKRLKLGLNLPFAEISDPKGVCHDITNVGGWGNGNAEALLESLDDLPNILGLVRQALERQLGDGSLPR